MSAVPANFFSVTNKITSRACEFFEFLRDKSGQNPHLTKSLILHFFLLLAFSGAIPSCTKPVKINTITVDILPLADQVKPNAVPQAKQQIAKPIPPKKVEPPKPKPKQEAIEKKKAIEKPQPKKTDLPSLKKEEVQKKPEPQPDIVKKQELNKEKEDQAGKKSLLKDLEKKEESLDELFDQIDKEAPKEPVKQQPKAQAQTKSTEDVVDAAFARDLIQKVQSQIARCWSIPIGAKEVQDMQVRLYISLDSTGNVLQVKVLDTGLYNSNNIFRVLADSAVWAVKDCSPLQGLPTDKYQFWKEIEFNFDPAAMAQ